MHDATYDRYLSSRVWKAKRLQRQEIDNHSCQECGSNEKLVCHHLTYVRVGGWEYMEDLVTLCRSCHGKVHPYEGMIMPETPEEELRRLRAEIIQLNAERDKYVKLDAYIYMTGGIPGRNTPEGRSYDVAFVALMHDPTTGRVFPATMTTDFMPYKKFDPEEVAKLGGPYAIPSCNFFEGRVFDSEALLQGKEGTNVKCNHVPAQRLYRNLKGTGPIALSLIYWEYASDSPLW